MATYPSLSDQQIEEGVNYLLSGPSNLGQNFNGFSDYINAYLSGNSRAPFTYPNLINTYVAPITLGTSELLDSVTFKFTFSSTQATVPFSLGQPVTVVGTTDDTLYGRTYSPIGVVECTIDYVICRTIESYSGSSATGGTISFSITTIPTDPDLDPVYNFIPTDCNGLVTVYGASDKVFVSGQLLNIINTYGTTPAEGSDLLYTVAVNRYKVFLTDLANNSGYNYVFDKTISRKQYTTPGVPNGGYTLDPVDTIFTSIIDRPTIGYYWYALEVAYNVIPNPGTMIIGDLQVTDSTLELRSLSIQVVKQ
jgi:hypothetical protein